MNQPSIDTVAFKTTHHWIYCKSISWRSTRGYQKVRRMMRWNQYLLNYAYKFCREYKTTYILSVVKTLIINHFIIENNLYGMVTRRSLRWVPWRSTTSLFFNVTLYTLVFMNIKFDELLSEIGNVFKKTRVSLNMPA